MAAAAAAAEIGETTPEEAVVEAMPVARGAAVVEVEDMVRPRLID